MHILPRGNIHDAVEFVVRWEQVLEGLDVAVLRIVIARGIVIFYAKARLPHRVKSEAKASMSGEGGEVEAADFTSLERQFGFVVESEWLRCRWRKRRGFAVGDRPVIVGQRGLVVKDAGLGF